uniref:Striatin-interacting protein 1 n=1 Tax=Hirondellea gigas TaxID=1518452 RepID=A0A6A7FTZ4_9CRUS
MDDNGNGQKSGMPKLFEIYRRQRQDSDASMPECPEIDFIYADSDSYENEIAELYSYSEGSEFQLNLKAFEAVCGGARVLALWQSMTEQKRFSLLTRITDQMELCSREKRAQASRALLYIAQGCWGEVQSDQEQMSWVRCNCFTLLQCNAWSSCLQLLNIEIESWVSSDSNTSNNNKQQQQQHQASGSHVSLASSSQLRVLLSVLYTMVETLRWPSASDNEEEQRVREAFCADLAVPQEETGELLAVTLLGMVTRFCNSSPPHFPIRKLLLLLWKLLLVTLGGSETLRTVKVEYRVKAGLPPAADEDTVTVCRGLRPASPPAPSSDMLDQQQQQHNMVRRRPFRRSLMKQSSLDDSMGDLDLTGDEDPNAINSGGHGLGEDEDNIPLGDGSGEDSGISDGDDSDGHPVSPCGVLEDKEAMHPDIDPLDRPASPRAPTPSIPHSPPPPLPHSRALPWSPKVRQKDIDCFLDISREKFVGFALHGDRTTLAGLPPPIHEGVHTLTKHVYTSMSEVQMTREEEICRNPMSRPELDVPQTPAEVLYQCLLPTLPQCMIALLKVLLAAAPTSKAKTDSINIMADVLPEEMPLTVVQSMKLGLDVNRHKEVLVKAVSASLLLLLKHLKLNHVYQFEFMSQHLVFANCIPLILKFFNQNIMAYVQAKNTIALLDFPSCVIGDGADLSNDALLACIGAAAAGGPADDCKSVDGGNNGNLLGDVSPTAASGISSTSTATSSSTNNTGNNNSNTDGNSHNNTTGHTSSSNMCCWRNMFSCINLLRVLNKLCKWKHSRIMMLVVFKSAPIIKRTLMVKHAMLQLYVLKLLKMQTKYLGRQWRKSNMKILSAIYQMVRHRLNDDWAYGNDPDARPWDFQTEEFSLRAAVDRFNTRRYHHPFPENNDLEPVDNCIMSVLGRHVELTEEFTRCYEVWLQREVLNTTIHWDLLLSTNTNNSDNKSRDLCNNCKQKLVSKASSAAGATGSATNDMCDCYKKLVSEGGANEYYTPLIQQLGGKFGKQDDKRKLEDDDDEYEKKEKMKTMVKKTASNAATTASIVDIILDDADVPKQCDQNKGQQPTIDVDNYKH